MGDLVTIDGAMGEGGGQILRSALALSLATGRPCRLENIRAGRRDPGLLRQHLTAVKAAAAIGAATVAGDELGSFDLEFRPGSVVPGSYHFKIGSAGSTTLVLQGVLPALMTAQGSSEIILEGGTHNPHAPPFDFLERVLLPVLSRMGPHFEAFLERRGFYPAGGGRIRITTHPTPSLTPIDLLRRDRILARRAVALVSNLPRHIGERELSMVGALLGWSSKCLRFEPVRDATGPGNVLMLEVESEGLTELFTGFGRRGKPAERVATAVAEEVRRYLEAGVPVGSYLADQLLLPFALAGGGSFRTVRPSRHSETVIEIIRMFLDVTIAVEEEYEGVWRITTGSGSAG